MCLGSYYHEELGNNESKPDARAFYRDLSGFEISIVPCPDGWYVDYEPHDAIDPHTGNILNRRYEQ